MQPNLKEFSEYEFDELTDKIFELKARGHNEEALTLSREIIPILPTTANRFKHEMGIEALIATGMNLSKAVKTYGKEWLIA